MGVAAVGEVAGVVLVVVAAGGWEVSARSGPSVASSEKEQRLSKVQVIHHDVTWYNYTCIYTCESVILSNGV